MLLADKILERYHNDKKDGLAYLLDDGGFCGVASTKNNVKFAQDVDGRVTVTEGQITIDAFNEMCIAWLCLYKPSVIANDSMEVALDICNKQNEEKINQLQEENDELKETNQILNAQIL